MEKKNIDWSSIGFGYVQPTTDTYLILKTANGMRELYSTDPNIVTQRVCRCASVCAECIRRYEGIHYRRRTYRYFPS